MFELEETIWSAVAVVLVAAVGLKIVHKTQPKIYACISDASTGVIDGTKNLFSEARKAFREGYVSA
ncbi:MAG: hypothetical protein ACI9CF_001338 [Candidatus Omnitrophota bacterium]|jgi:hypothetical protein